MKIKTIHTLLVFVLAALTGCESFVEDLNVSPNNPSEAPADLTLTSTQVANIITHSGEAARRTGMWAGYFTGEASQYEAFQEYRVSGNDFNELWGDLYTGIIRNARVARQPDLAGSTDILRAITKVLEAHAATTAADLWGDVPFSDVNGSIPSGEVKDATKYTPRYQGQLEVYNLLLDLLDEAISELTAGTVQPRDNSDIYFDGDPAAWIEVAHTLKARIFLHQKNYESAYAEASLGISSPENSMLAPHYEPQDGRNLYEQFMTSNRAEEFSADGSYLSTLLSRNSAMYRGNAKTDESGRFNWYFLEGETLNPNFDDGYFSTTAPFPLITYEENLLILAEAGLRTEGFATALNHLNEFRAYLNDGQFMGQEITFDGVQYDPYAVEDFAPGGIENPNGLAADRALLKEILEERYVTFYGQIEGYNDLRRTWNESDVRVAVPLVTGNTLPQRFLYPQTEVDRNGANIPAPYPDLFTPTPVNQ